MLSQRSAVVLALLVSFAIYFIPIVAGDAGRYLGELFKPLLKPQELVESGDSWWYATNIVFALLLQALAFTLIYRFLRKPSAGRGLLLAVSVPLFFVVATLAYLFFIPALFFIGIDFGRETGNWSVECEADASLESVQMPADIGEKPISEVLVRVGNTDYATMSIPGCALTPLAVSVTAYYGNVVAHDVGNPRGRVRPSRE